MAAWQSIYSGIPGGGYFPNYPSNPVLPPLPPTPKFEIDVFVFQLDETCKSDKPKDKKACPLFPQLEWANCHNQGFVLCHDKVSKGVETHCSKYKDSPACEWLIVKTRTTTASWKNMLPFIIGGAVGVIVLLVMGIGLYCYCRKKKKMGGQSKTQGLNTSGTTVNSGTATGTTATGANGNPPLQNPPPPYNGEMF